MDVDKQIRLMNDMLDYLGKCSFTLKWHGNYKEYVLVYTRTDSIMRKRVTEWDYNGHVKARTNKEKALGGTNGRDMYVAIRKATLEKAEKKVLKTAVERELADYGIDAREL